ncbi:hypothetical protein GR212_26495 [Rhizobium lusitanum]|uniref:Uncharacterized protein n=1 Tax=Rhizobium lusitanum TaxID=293958 RepID=A0A6L9UCP5_9HYPH|nr:hypothetical protein [Rhizobium lusitanum]NEI73119.1 hypothetical protein [Rhizobium lusitanum]
MANSKAFEVDKKAGKLAAAEERDAFIAGLIIGKSIFFEEQHHDITNTENGRRGVAGRTRRIDNADADRLFNAVVSFVKVIPKNSNDRLVVALPRENDSRIAVLVSPDCQLLSSLHRANLTLPDRLITVFR